MKIAIMQPYFFPYIGYWQLVNEVDKFVIFDDVNFINKGWINRNRILIDGEPRYINIQLKKASQNKLIKETEVICDDVYNKKLLKTIETNYKKAPYFDSVYPLLADVITYKEENLSKFLVYSIKQICQYLSIDTEIIISSKLNKNSDLKGQDKIIQMCKILNTSEYYNTIGGQELYSYEDFRKENIVLKFLKSICREYNQFNSKFVPDLSIIDVMMFNAKDNLSTRLNQFELV